MKLATRILKVLKDGGPRTPWMFRGLAKSDAEFEQAIGRLFLDGTVVWQGQKRGRVLAARTRP